MSPVTESPKGIAMTAFALSGPITLDARVMHGSLSVQAREGITQARRCG